MTQQEILNAWYVSKINQILLEYEYSNKTETKSQYAKMTESELAEFEKNKTVPESIKIFLHMVYGQPDTLITK